MNKRALLLPGLAGIAALLILGLIGKGDRPVSYGGSDAPPGGLSISRVTAVTGFMPGPFAPTRTREITLVHGNGRTVKARATAPAGNGPFPIILFSPDFGSDKDQYNALIDHWASHGYLVLATDHADSGGRVAATLARIRYGNIGLLEKRLEDLLQLWASLGKFPGVDLLAIADTYNVIAAGHSLGALAAQIVGGAVVQNRSGFAVAWTGPAVRAVVALSPPGEMRNVITADTWSGFLGPALLTTGTVDLNPWGTPDWQLNLASFELAPPGVQYALVVEGADRNLGNRIGQTGSGEPAVGVALDIVRGVSTVFLQGYVRGDPAARAWLDLNELQEATSGLAQLRSR